MSTAVSGKPRVFRSTAALVGGWTWMVFAALNLLDVAIRGRDTASLVATAVLLTGCGIAYVLGIRPRVTADDSGVRVRNPFRDADLPWRSVRTVDATDAVRIHYAGPDSSDQVVRVWCLPSSPRARAKAERQSRRDAATLPKDVAKQVAGKTPVKYAVEQLTELAAAHRKGDPATGTVRWSLLAILSLVLPVALLAITLLIATL
jgi:hypothetical protein